MSRFYWTTRTHRGQSVTLTTGGHYESINEHGEASQRPGGFNKSQEAEIPASKSPDASLFAKIQSASQAGAEAAVGEYHLYSTTAAPDKDASRSIVADFSLLEEVRYIVEDNDQVVTFVHEQSVSVPARAVEDVIACYYDGVVSEWGGQLVKQTLAQTILRGRQYPPTGVDFDEHNPYSEYDDHRP